LKNIVEQPCVAKEAFQNLQTLRRPLTNGQQ